MQTVDIIILILMTILLSFQGYCLFFHMQDRHLPVFSPDRQLMYTSAFNFFSMAQWILVIFNLSWIFGWYGIIVFLIIYTISYLLTKSYFTWTNMNPNTSLAIFGVLFWSLFFTTIVKVVIHLI